MIREDFWLPWDLRVFLYLCHIFIDNITVAEKGLSQNIFPKINKCFSNRQLISKRRYFSYRNFYLNKSIVFKPIHRISFKSRNLFQIDKKIKKDKFFSNRHKKFKSVSLFQILKKNWRFTNPFQIHKIMKNRQIFLKPQKK